MGAQVAFNWAALAAICSLIGVLATIIGVAFTYGQLTQNLKESRRLIDEHTVTLEAHAAKLNEHDVEIAKMQEWRNGYNAASRAFGQSASL